MFLDEDKANAAFQHMKMTYGDEPNNGGDDRRCVIYKTEVNDWKVDEGSSKKRKDR